MPVTKPVPVWAALGEQSRVWVAVSEGHEGALVLGVSASQEAAVWLGAEEAASYWGEAARPAAEAALLADGEWASDDGGSLRVRVTDAPLFVS